MEFVEYDKDLYHYCRVLWECHLLWNFSNFYKLLDEDCTLDAQRQTFQKKEGKDEIIKFFDGKETPSHVVMLEWNMKKSPVKVKVANDTKVSKSWDVIWLKIMYEDGKICLLLNQMFSDEDKFYEYLFMMDLNKKWLIEKIYIWMPAFYDFHEFLLPRDFNRKELWKDWYPKYEEDNIFNDQELCNLWNMATVLMLEDYWFKVTYMQPRLDKFPNVIAEKDGRKLYFTVRGFHSKDLAWQRGEDWLFWREIYSKNLMYSWLIEKSKEMAERNWAEYHYSIVYFTSNDPELRKKWIITRGDNYEYDVCRLEPWDF